MLYIAIAALMVLTAILFWTAGSLFGQYRLLHSRGYLDIGRLHELRSFSLRYQRFDMPSPDSIQPWMTYRYVNTIFGLPSHYVSQKLGITDSRYPNLVIGTLPLNNLKAALRAYLASQKKTQ